jgi:hypothetical protein
MSRKGEKVEEGRQKQGTPQYFPFLPSAHLIDREAVYFAVTILSLLVFRNPARRGWFIVL